METTLYRDLKSAGCKLEHHESDLYVKATPEARAIIARHKADSSDFVDSIDGDLWIEVPFLWEPHWNPYADLTA